MLYADYSHYCFATDDIEHLTHDEIEKLHCGDNVIKVTVDGEGNVLKHCYVVTHRQETGICISYFNCGYSETISYDKVDGVWTFNSKDVWQAE